MATIASFAADGNFQICRNTTASAEHVRAAIQRLKPITRKKVLAALCDDGGGIAQLDAATLAETRNAIYSVLMLQRAD